MARKLFQKLTSTSPRWATALSTQQYELFHEKLLVFSDGVIDTDKTDNLGLLHYGEGEINLNNLASLCANLPLEDWDAEIKRWIRVGSEPIAKEPSTAVELTVQFYPIGYFGDRREEQKYPVREDIPGVLTTVVIDEPDRLVVATKAFLNEHAAYTDDTLTVLSDKLRKETPYSVDFVTLHDDDETLVAVIHDNDATTATHALALDALYPQLIGEYGALVGIPHRHLIVVKRLDEEPSREVVEQLAALVEKIAKGQAGLVTDNIYYLRDNKFVLAQ